MFYCRNREQSRCLAWVTLLSMLLILVLAAPQSARADAWYLTFDVTFYSAESSVSDGSVFESCLDVTGELVIMINNNTGIAGIEGPANNVNTHTDYGEFDYFFASLISSSFLGAQYPDGYGMPEGIFIHNIGCYNDVTTKTYIRVGSTDEDWDIRNSLSFDDFLEPGTTHAVRYDVYDRSQGTTIDYAILMGDATLRSKSQVPPTVPEPASLLLLGSGLTGLAWYRRGKARRG